MHPSEIVYNVIEFAKNGSLSTIIKYTGGFDETVAKFYFTQIWHAVAYIHSFGIAHMDIKLDNILLDEFFNAKLADFGISVDVSKTEGLSDCICGTANYMAPEVAHLLPTETYDAYKADVYSLGMCLYLMLFGELPLEENYDTCSMEDSETIGWITGLKPSENCKKKWDLSSCHLQELVGNMLSMDPDVRPSLQEILEWDWINYHNNLWSPQDVFEDMEQRWIIISKIKQYTVFDVVQPPPLWLVPLLVWQNLGRWQLHWEKKFI